MSQRYKIRFLNGSLEGRQLVLPEGEFIIGGPESDLVLVVKGGTQVVLAPSGDIVEITTDAPVWRNGAKVPKAGMYVVPMLEAVEVGGIAFVCGRAEDVLPHLRLRKRHKGGAIALLALSAICLATCVSAVGALGVWFVGQPKPNQSATTTQWLGDWEKQAAQEGLALTQRKDGQYELTGECSDSVIRDRLLRVLRAKDVDYYDRSLCSDELVRNVLAALNLQGYTDVKVKPGGQPGYVEISGQITADGRWQEVTNTLTNMPGLKHWAVQDRASAEVKALIDRLRSTPLIKQLSVVRENGVVFVTGILNSPDQAKLDQILQGFTGDYPNAPKVIYQNIAANQLPRGIFPAPIVSLGGNKQLVYLELQGGVRVQVGSRLPSGYLIVRLDESGVDLERDGQLIHLALDL